MRVSAKIKRRNAVLRNQIATPKQSRQPRKRSTSVILGKVRTCNREFGCDQPRHNAEGAQSKRSGILCAVLARSDRRECSDWIDCIRLQCVGGLIAKARGGQVALHEADGAGIVQCAVNIGFDHQRDVESSGSFCEKSAPSELPTVAAQYFSGVASGRCQTACGEPLDDHGQQPLLLYTALQYGKRGRTGGGGVICMVVCNRRERGSG
jgi:hypothetical protein